MRILAVNAGSSSIKLRLIDSDDSLLTASDLALGDDENRSEDGIDAAALRRVIGGVEGVESVGHRIVHGGIRFTDAVLLDPQVEEALQRLTLLAPLHQQKALSAFRAVRSVLPNAPAVACFDTAFHSSMPDAAKTYAVPSEWRERLGVRRYGFHGLSHSYASRRAAQMLGRESVGLRVVTCHLGAGASLCAILDGRSVDTTMGFTPLEGLVMATRSGTVDPGLVLWLQQHAAMSAAQLADDLEHSSGLKALAGTPDMRQVLVDAARGEPEATLAIEVYTHRLRAAVASMAAALGGMDVLAFTGGVGQHAASVRERAAVGLAFMGVELDDALNDAVDGDADISAGGAKVRTLVIEAREDLEIARATRRVLGG
jgi:acetate kinase